MSYPIFYIADQINGTIFETHDEAEARARLVEYIQEGYESNLELIGMDFKTKEEAYKAAKSFFVLLKLDKI